MDYLDYDYISKYYDPLDGVELGEDENQLGDEFDEETLKLLEVIE